MHPHCSISRREFLVMAALASALPNSLAASKQRTHKKLIAWGWDTAYPSKIQMNIRTIEALPFDGIVLTHFKARDGREEVMFEWRGFGSERFEEHQLAGTIDTLRSIRFRRFTDNFLRFNTQPGGVDWFDDFSSIVQNCALWAKVARDAGMKGWLFDLEDYNERVFTFGKQKYATRRSFDEYAHQVHLRGTQVMHEVQAIYPNITLILSVAHSYVNRSPDAARRLQTLESGLLPAFVNGLIEASGPRVRLIDGQEQAYGHLTAREFAAGYRAIREDALELVPAELREKYRGTMEAGVGMWANYQLAVPVTTSRYWPPHYMTPQQRLRLFEQNVYHALATTDEYAWLYSEQMGWWEHGYPSPTPVGAIAAIRAARAKIENNLPVGLDLDTVVANARSKMAAAVRSNNGFSDR